MINIHNTSGYLLSRSFILGALLLHWAVLSAQVSGVDVVGSPVPSVTAIGHHAMGVNPALFSVLDTSFKSERFVSSFEGHIAASGPISRETSLIQIFGAGEPWTLEQKRELAAALPTAPTRAEMNLRWAGWSRKNQTGGWGWSVQDHLATSFQPGQGLAELALLGPLASYFDLLITTAGDTIANSPNLSEEQAATVTQGLASNPLDLLTFLGDTKLSASYARSYSLGAGVRLIDTPALRIGAGLAARYYRGRGYYEVDTESGAAFAAFNKGLGAALLSPDATLGSVLHPAGYGVGLDFGLRVDVANALFGSLAITDLGRMEWTGEHYKLTNPLAVADAQGEVGALFEALTSTLDPVELFVESEPERRVVNLPMRFALAGGINLSDRSVLAVELSAPLKPQFIQAPTTLGLGGRLAWGPVQLIGGPRIEFGQGLAWPFAVAFGGGEGHWELGLATGDALAIWEPVKSFSAAWSLTYRK
jgi:hypothetical protein